MNNSFDPRNPRRNPEVDDIMKAMKSRWEELIRSPNHTQLIGNAAIMGAHIEQLLDEPEFVYDLAKGTARPQRDLLMPPGDAGEAVLEDPFEKPGISKDRFFYFNYNSRITPLLEKDQLSLYDPFRMSVYWVQVLEKRYAAEKETSMHFTSETALERWTPKKTHPELAPGEIHFVLGDPLGFYDGLSVKNVYKTADLEKAIKEADRLSNSYDIRFLVATFRDIFHTH